MTQRRKNPYFKISEGSKSVPFYHILEREPPNHDKLQRARILMEKARNGTGPKRSPIIVEDQGHGTYKVVDGNTTLHVLRELGESKAVVKVQGHKIRG